MAGAGNVTPDKVAPSEPTIDTILIMMLIAGKGEKRNTARAWDAITNRTEVRFNGQNPQEKGIFIRPNIT